MKLKRRLDLKNLWETAGPGVISGAADDDPSGIGTYTITGVQFGTQMLWTALLTWPLMALVQLACARIGMVTGQGLASALSNKFSRVVVVVICALLFITNTLNVGADLLAMGEAAQFAFGGRASIYALICGIGITLATIFLSYRQIAKGLEILALSLFAYVGAAFLAKPDWSQVWRDTFIPHWPSSSEQWKTLVAIFGTTISPYLFFWQTYQEVEEGHSKRRPIVLRMWARRYDVILGTFFSNLVMFFIIVASAFTLGRNGVTNIETSLQAAKALEPIAGRFSSLLYSVGLIGVGLLAIPTLTGSAAYALAESFGWSAGLNASVNRARGFYFVICLATAIALAFDFMGFNPIKALYFSALFNGYLAPFILAGIFLVIRDRKIMKGRPAPWGTQALVLITTLTMFLAAVNF